jgi:hypothetical protein
VNGTLFVADQNEFHLGFDCLERVKNGYGSTSRISENVFDSEVVEGFDERLRTVEGFVLGHGDKTSVRRGRVFSGFTADLQEKIASVG